jgi:hypothetical protein
MEIAQEWANSDQETSEWPTIDELIGLVNTAVSGHHREGPLCEKRVPAAIRASNAHARAFTNSQLWSFTNF